MQDFIMASVQLNETVETLKLNAVCFIASSGTFDATLVDRAIYFGVKEMLRSIWLQFNLARRIDMTFLSNSAAAAT